MSLRIPKKKPGRKTETTELYKVMGAINRLPQCRVFRNNTGSLPDRRGIPVWFGLAVGSADLIGSVQVGAHAIPIFIEMKKPGKVRTPDQEAWCAAVTALGWHGGVATNVEEALAIVDGARRRLLVDEPTVLTRHYKKGIFDERMEVWQWVKHSTREQRDNVHPDFFLRGEHCQANAARRAKEAT